MAILIDATPLCELTHLQALAKVVELEKMCQHLRDEIEDTATLSARLGALLHNVAIGLKGPPRPLHGHDWSDLPQVAADMRAEVLGSRRRDRRDNDKALDE